MIQKWGNTEGSNNENQSRYDEFQRIQENEKTLDYRFDNQALVRFYTPQYFALF
jgi:hypothetical protein